MKKRSIKTALFDRIPCGAELLIIQFQAHAIVYFVVFQRDMVLVGYSVDGFESDTEEVFVF
jgi:hypothetical protein